MNLTLDIINSLLLVWIKPAIVLAVVIYLVSRTNFRGAATNHWILLNGLLSPLALVFFFLFLPAWDIDVLPLSVARFADVTVVSGSQGPTDGPNFGTLFVTGVYLFGFFWVISYLALGLASIAQKTRTSERLENGQVLELLNEISGRYGIRRPVAAFVSDAIHSPLVWGWRRPAILLPAKFRHWSRQRLQRILAHEMAHVARNDWLVKLFSQLICATFWFLPPVWLVARRLEWYAELACDDLLITHYHCRAEYADDLLLLSSEFRNEYFALSFIKRSELYRRINAVLDGGRVREYPKRSTKLLILLTTVGLLLPLSAVHPIAGQSAEENHNYYSISLDSGAKPERKKRNGLFDAEKVEVVSLSVLRKNYILDISRATPEEVVISAGVAPAITVDTNLPQPNFTPADFPQPLLSSVKVEGYLPVVMKTPDYPARALRNNIEGTVIVQFDISDRGDVLDPRIVLSEPKEVFDSSVIKAIKKYSFRPLRVNGKAIITKNVTETFVFKIEDATDKPKVNPRLAARES